MRYQQAHVIQPMCYELYPYQESAHNRTKEEYVNLAGQQQRLTFNRQQEFLLRLSAHRELNESLRSFPCELNKPFAGYQMPTQPRMQLGAVALELTSASHHLFEEVPYGTMDDYDHLQTEDGHAFENEDRNVGAVPLESVSHITISEDEEGIDWSNAKSGVIRQVGRYHYKFDNKESMSYLIRLGQHEYVWGIDLERLANLHKLKRGDRISLKCIGKQPVEVEVRELQEDQTYKVVTKMVDRNTWVAKVHQRAAMPAQD